MTRMTTDPPMPVGPEIIAIVSQKGGVGKTTTAINLSMALAAAGRRVLLVELDPQGHTGHNLVRGAHGGSDIGHALREAALTRDMIAATEIPDLFLAPAGPGLDGLESELTLMGDSRTRLHQALGTLPELSQRFDHVVIDCPPALGLLTLNAMTAAHRILMPLPCESVVLEGLPAVLKTISRLRAGLSQPFHGVQLLVVMRIPNAQSQSLVAALRQDYGRMTLLTEIPAGAEVREAAERNRPLLIHCPACEVSQAYLALAAEWLTLGAQDGQPEGTWRFRSRQDTMLRHREDMRKRIEAWMIDPSSLLYDPDEAMRHQDALVLDELFQVTQGSNRHARSRVPMALAAVVLILVALPAAFLAQTRSPDAQWRIEIGALLIGAERFWQAGSLLLARADEKAYRELLLATQLVEENRDRLIACGEQARESGGATVCAIDVPSP